MYYVVFVDYFTTSGTWIIRQLISYDLDEYY